MNISCPKGKVPWKKLERCLGILKSGVLLPKEMKIPDKVNITVFKPDILPVLMLMNSAVDYILKNLSATYESITVFDEKGIYQSYIEKLINSFSSVKVVTPKVSDYEEVSRRLLENYGFSLVVSSREVYDSEIIISEDCSVPSYYSGKVLSTNKKYIMNAEVFTGSGIELPEEYEKLCPDNIDRILFASALYEKCGVRDIGSLRYSDFGC